MILVQNTERDGLLVSCGSGSCVHVHVKMEKNYPSLPKSTFLYCSLCDKEQMQGAAHTGMATKAKEPLLEHKCKSQCRQSPVPPQK